PRPGPCVLREAARGVLRGYSSSLPCAQLRTGQGRQRMTHSSGLPSFSRVCSNQSVADFHGQQLVDAPAIEIDDLEAPTLYLDAIADVRYPAELAEQKTGH